MFTKLWSLPTDSWPVSWLSSVCFYVFICYPWGLTNAELRAVAIHFFRQQRDLIVRQVRRLFNMSTPVPASITFTAVASSSDVPIRLPPPPPQPTDDNDDEPSDDEAEEHEADHDHESSMWSDWSSVSSATFQRSLLPSSISVDPSSMTTTLFPAAPTSTTSSTQATMTSDRPSSSAEKPGMIAEATAQVFGSTDPDSTPNNIADPGLEAKTSSSPLGTAGIVLASVFGCIALFTTFYLLYRLSRRRKAFHRSSRTSGGHAGSSLEKGLHVTWPSTVQETGVIFAQPRSQVIPQEQRQHSRFSFLHRRWYSTGTDFSSSPRSSSVVSTSTRPFPWARSFFNSGLGLRSSGEDGAVSDRTASTDALDDQYTANAALHRNFSQRSTGLGHARAYAHHGFRAPASPDAARSRISIISGRWLRRRRTSAGSADRTIGSDVVHETSQLYDSSSLGSPVSNDGRMSLRTMSDQSVRRCRQSAKVPRLPLPVAVSTRQHSGTWFAD